VCIRLVAEAPPGHGEQTATVLPQNSSAW
jgi:hypothetical protein